MVNCKYCGEEISETDQYCTMCGKAQLTNNQIEKEVIKKFSQNKYYLRIILGISGGLLGISAGLMIMELSVTLANFVNLIYSFTSGIYSGGLFYYTGVSIIFTSIGGFIVSLGKNRSYNFLLFLCGLTLLTTAFTSMDGLIGGFCFLIAGIINPTK